MPRNSTGNYTLPLPPVVSGELIEAAWANTTLDDIGQAITDSLDRYGRGGMLASFLFADGTVSNPGAAWANAPGTGFYRDSTHLGFTWNGAEVFSYNANGISGKVNTLTMAGNLNMGGDLMFSYGNTEAGTSIIAVDTPDGLGRASINFVQSASGAGSDSYIEFYTAYFGVSRAKRMQIDPNGLTRFYAGARVEYGSAFGWLSDSGTDAWRMDIDTAENMYIYNVGLAKSQLTLQGDGSTVVNGGALVAQQGTTFNFRNIGNTSNAWVMGAADFYGSDTFGIYNAVMGTWFLTVNPTLNYAEFTNSVRAPYVDTPNSVSGDLVTITAQGDPSVRFLKNGASDWNILAPSDGNLNLWRSGNLHVNFMSDGNTAFVNSVFSDQSMNAKNTGGTGYNTMAFKASGTYGGGLGMHDPGQGYLTLFCESGAARLYVSNEDGSQYVWMNFRGVGQNIAVPFQFRASQIVATPTP